MIEILDVRREEYIHAIQYTMKHMPKQKQVTESLLTRTEQLKKFRLKLEKGQNLDKAEIG